MEPPETLQFIESPQGKKLIFIDGFKFFRHHLVGTTAHYICSQRRNHCNAGITVNDFNEETCAYSSFQMRGNPHNHEPSTNLEKEMKPRETEEVIMKCPDKLTFITSKRQRKLVLIDNFTFCRSKVKKKNTYFVCSVKTCKAGLSVTDLNEDYSYSSFRMKNVLHNHEPYSADEIRKKINRVEGRLIINMKTGKPLEKDELKALEDRVLGRDPHPQTSQPQLAEADDDAEEVTTMKIKEELIKTEEPPFPMDSMDVWASEEEGVPSPMSPPTPPANETDCQPCLICSTSFENGARQYPDDGANTNLKRKDGKSWSMFFLRGILSLSKEHIEKLLHQFELNTLRSDPEGWFSICPVCFKSVEQVYKMNEKLMAIERDVLLLQDEIERKMKASLREEKSPGVRYKDGVVASVPEQFREILKAAERESNRHQLRNILEERLGITAEGNPFQYSITGSSYCQSASTINGTIEDESDNRENEMKPDNIPDAEIIDVNVHSIEDNGFDDDDDFMDYDNDCSGKGPDAHAGARRSSRYSVRKKYEEVDSNESQSSESEDDPPYKPDLITSRSIPTSPRKREKSVKNPTSKSVQIKLKYNHKTPVKQVDSSTKGKNQGRVLEKCSLCPHRFTWIGDKLQHMLNHETLTEFVCRECNRPYAHEKGLNIHMVQSHGAEAAPKLKCDRCNFTTERPNQLQKHMQNHRLENLVLDNPAGGYSCTFCSQVFPTRANAHSHLGERHKEEAGVSAFVCHVCGSIKLSEIVLRAHIRKVHMKMLSRHKCEECGKPFQSKLRLENHKLRHKPPGQGKVICEICGLEYANQTGLNCHIKKFHENIPGSQKNAKKAGKSEKKCPLCGVNVVHQRAIYIHMKTCHAEQHQFECDQCEGRFFKEINLKNHKIGVHSTEEFPCPSCKSVFKCEDYVKRHLRLNCKNNPTSKHCLKLALLGMGGVSQNEKA